MINLRSNKTYCIIGGHYSERCYSEYHDLCECRVFRTTPTSTVPYIGSFLKDSYSRRCCILFPKKVMDVYLQILELFRIKHGVRTICQRYEGRKFRSPYRTEDLIKGKIGGQKIQTWNWTLIARNSFDHFVCGIAIINSGLRNLINVTKSWHIWRHFGCTKFDSVTSMLLALGPAKLWDCAA